MGASTSTTVDFRGNSPFIFVTFSFQTPYMFTRFRTFLLFIVNSLNTLIPPTRAYRFKALMYNAVPGFDVSRTSRIVSSVRIWGIKRLVVGSDAFVGHETLITGGDAVVRIEACVDIAPRVCLVAGSHVLDMCGIRSAGPAISNDIVIEEGAWIGTNSTILGGVRIGKHSVIGAGSMVNRDIPPYSLAVGIPCRVIKRWDLATGCWKSQLNG